MSDKDKFPGGKSFAFTVLDDTDLCTVEKVAPVYRLLEELGIFTTKSVWPLRALPGTYHGATLEEKDYARFILGLNAKGFEIGLHNVRNGSAERQITEYGIRRFCDLLGYYPRVQSNHNNNCENLYWGSQRFTSPAVRLAYQLSTRFRRISLGSVENSPYFWGDLCQRHISYVRNLIFDAVNLDRINPSLPYHENTKPYVNYWFSSARGDSVRTFCRLLKEAHQDQLEQEGGVCIVYAHFAYGFCQDNAVDREFERLVRRLSRKNGWFVPVSILLDHLRKARSAGAISHKELTSMDRRWLFSRILHRKPSVSEITFSHGF